LGAGSRLISPSPTQIVSKGHDQLPYAGKGSKMDRGDAERLFQLLASESALGERFERNALGFTNAYVTVGPKARNVLNGSQKLEMGISAGGAKKAVAPAGASVKGADVSFEDDDEAIDDGDDGAVTGVLPWNPLARKSAKAKAKEAAPSDTDAIFAQMISLREQVSLETLTAKDFALNVLRFASRRSRRTANRSTSSRTTPSKYGSRPRRPLPFRH
jgi:superfamily II DNA helicase RecQ